MDKKIAHMEFLHDENGQELLLKDGQFQVMMEWEKPYMKACIESLQPSGDVLEIGFGCGYSATYIQEYKPKSHTIIEYHPVVANKAREWALKHPNITIIEDTWQNALKNLGVFDVVFFDDCPLERISETIKKEKELNFAEKIIQKEKNEMKELSKKLSFLNNFKYTNADFKNFINLLSKKDVIEEEYLLTFLFDLRDKNNISENLLKEALKLLQKKGHINKTNIDNTFIKQNLSKKEHRLFFLEKCIENHMRKGSRFSCFLEDATSKYHNKNFLDHVISNPKIKYSEKTIPIKVPSNCKYYKDDKALVITITKI